ncbi:MAG TPA: hypothetical protein VG318_11820 [Actinomycetota bacterium]|nr:hypothetical protein [Actinomycetota bacterium]
MTLPRLRAGHEPLPLVTTSDLSRSPNDVLTRVECGQRLLVCRHKHPVATLQPLDGYVFQPFTGTAQDVFGWPFGDEASQTERLSEPQQRMLTDCYRDWRIRPGRIEPPFDWSTLMRALEDMYVRGLVVKTPRGNELTGRGLALRETLLRMEGREA